MFRWSLGPHAEMENKPTFLESVREKLIPSSSENKPEGNGFNRVFFSFFSLEFSHYFRWIVSFTI